MLCCVILYCVMCATEANFYKTKAKEMNLILILKVKYQFTGSEPIPVCISDPGLVWKKHHGHKVGLKQTPLRGHHPSPGASESLKLDVSLIKTHQFCSIGCVYGA